jgi:adenylate kinase family enzyme
MDKSARIHITGASGSGVTTLGAALAERLGAPQFDVDDFFWLPSDPPFMQKRPVAERLELLTERLVGEKWILSGSLVGWGDPFMPCFDAVVFLYAPSDVRMARLRAREFARYGEAIEPGGAMHENSRAFLDWAARYDEPHFEGRSLAIHNRWLAKQSAPVLRLDGTAPTADQVKTVIAHFEG